MQKVIQISLSGHPTMFQLAEDAYASLQAYLDRARSRLKRDPDRDEVLRDLEQSIGDKLAALLRSENRVISRREIDAILEQVGAVNTGNGEGPAVAAPPHRPRRLCRIQEGEWFAGVCQGLAAYSSIDVAWVRTIFILLTICTGGLPIILYIVLMFVLPVARTYDEYIAMQSDANATPR
jgi:phage shock protein PspC (stress-responsive transcriptional regulator)